MIGVVLFTGLDHPDIGHPFFQDVLVGLKHGIGSGGYDVLLFATERPDSVATAPTRISGAHATTASTESCSWASTMKIPRSLKLVEADVPLIGVDLDVSGAARELRQPPTTSAAPASRYGICMDSATGGSRRSPARRNTSLGRIVWSVIRAELHALGIERHPEYEQIGDWYTESGERAMQTLLALPEPPTAVFAAADLMAVGAMKAARDAGLDVPEDLAVVGFDDIQLASLLNPGLTTIHQDKVGLGRAAARALLEQIENPDSSPAALTLPVELIIRASCGWTREAVGATTISRGPIAERTQGGKG